MLNKFQSVYRTDCNLILKKSEKRTIEKINTIREKKRIFFVLSFALLFANVLNSACQLIASCTWWSTIDTNRERASVRRTCRLSWNNFSLSLFLKNTNWIFHFAYFDYVSAPFPWLPPEKEETWFNRTDKLLQKPSSAGGNLMIWSINPIDWIDTTREESIYIYP